MRSISKRLITKNNVNDFIDKSNEVIYIEEDMILTPGAKDVLRNKGIVIKFGSKPWCKEESKTESIKDQIVNILKNDYGISDSNMMSEVLKAVLKKI